MIHPAPAPAIHATLPRPRPAHVAEFLALPAATLAGVATTSPDTLGRCIARYCSGEHRDDSVRPDQHGPVALWGIVTRGGAA